MQCTSCDSDLDLLNKGYVVREECQHTVCKECINLPICGACFKAQMLQQKKLKEQNQQQKHLLQTMQQDVSKPPPNQLNVRGIPPLMTPQRFVQPVPPKPPVICSPRPSQETKKKRVDGKEDVSNRMVKIGNLPYTTTAEELSTMFTLCGGIVFPSQVFPYKDFKNEEQNYGIITFLDEKSAKLALLHHGKVFKGNVLSVANNKDATFTIFVSNFPAGNDQDSVMTFFEAYGEVKSVSKLQESKYFVNFAEDHVRRHVMSLTIRAPSPAGLITLKLSLKEPTKKTGTIGAKPNGDEFALILEELPSKLASKSRLEEMFELFGPLDLKQVRYNQEKSLATWKISFTTKAMRDQALQFNKSRPNKWNLEIKFSMPGEKERLKREERKKDLGKDTSVSTVNMNKKSQTTGSSKETILLQGTSKKGKATSQPVLSQKNPKFAVRVTGFDKNTKGQDLESYFFDAGSIEKCEVMIPRNGNPFAEITYKTEEGMNTAVGWSPCLLGYPSQTLVITRLN